MFEEAQVLGRRMIAAAWDEARVFGDGDERSARLVAGLEFVAELEARLAGVRMFLLSEAQAALDHKTVDRFRADTRNTTPRASADLRLAPDLMDRFSLIGQALEQGMVSLAQAEAMVGGLNTLPVHLSRAEWERCQKELLAEVGMLGPSELRALASRMLEIIDPDTAEEQEARRLERERDRAERTRVLKLRHDHHGSMVISGRLPIAEGSLLKAQLEAAMPSVTSYDERAVSPDLGTRRADALVVLTQIAAASGQLPAHGMDRPTVHITLGLETLRSGLGRISVLGGKDYEQLGAGDARRLACDANLIPVVLGGDTEPLDVGRAHRLVTKPIRAALVERDRGCAFPHCSAAAAACEAHHILPWWAGGATALENLVLLCAHHHRLVEPDPERSPESQWQASVDQVTGLAVFKPPAYVDPGRRPRQHRRFRITAKRLQPAQLDAAGEAPRPVERRMPTWTTRDEVLWERAHPDPKDDPWHPDYEPPPRTPPPVKVVAPERPAHWQADDTS